MVIGMIYLESVIHISCGVIDEGHSGAYFLPKVMMSPLVLFGG